jgi:phosphopantothenoylcysteine decarboxylase/phosphopantothenate--cysteine ligase
MNCIVTAGPTYEELDAVRRLTNFSSGRLGSELANFLAARGHRVELLLGHYSTWRGEQKAQRIQGFSTTADLRHRFEQLSSAEVDAVFHAAAVSDFTFGKIFARSVNGKLAEISSKKISTRGEPLLAELVSTFKIISQLRQWFPKACLIGWKLELEGARADVIVKAEQQIAANKTDACVANGRAYGKGFGLVTGPDQCAHYPDTGTLFEALEELAAQKQKR